MKKYYQYPLAIIHDKHFGDLAKNAALEIVNHIWADQTGKKVIDLGCGSGILASILSSHNFNVTGVDISEDILQIARKRAPTAQFIHSSLHDFKFSSCDMVTAIGEPINYLFDHKSSYGSCQTLFQRIYNHLSKGGLFIFDFLTTRMPSTETNRIIEKEDMTIFVSVSVDTSQSVLYRKMSYFVKQGDCYIKDSETHKQLLFDEETICHQLRSIGFQIEKIDGYNGFKFREGHTGLIGKK